MTNTSIKAIGVLQLHELRERQPVELIDVRTPEEFHGIRARNARNLPLATLDPPTLLNSRAIGENEPIYFICEVGVRSEYACARMIAAGFPNAINVEGGTAAWIEAGLPIERGTIPA